MRPMRPSATSYSDVVQVIAEHVAFGEPDEKGHDGGAGSGTGTIREFR
jgi:hypothetical protein